MNPPQACDLVREARASAEEVYRLLVKPSPESLTRCSELLERACAALQSYTPAAALHSSLSEVRQLRSTVRRAAALLDHARHYHGRWAEWVAVQTGGYLPGGTPAQVDRKGTLCLRA